MKAAISVDQAEIEKFSQMADSWWDEHGSFKPLHQLNPTRIRYIRDYCIKHFARDTNTLRPLDGLKLLDIGCGGGLVSEPMARLGAQVTGADASERNITIASVHAQASGLQIDYRATTAEALAESGEQFDVILALEIVEHVADLDAFLSAISTLLKPNGVVILSTLNRTVKSYAMAILGAEYILRWMPIGTHEWKKFLRPSELAHAVRQQNLHMAHLCGMVFSPLDHSWSLNEKNLNVNYFLTATKG